MKKVFLIISFFISVFVNAQTPQTSYVVTSIATMKTYFGNANRIHITATNEDYVSCPTCTADEITIYAGAGGRKWKKVSDDLKLTKYLTSGYFFVGNGSGIATGVPMSGDITIDNAGLTAIGASKVTNSMLAGSIAYSKLSLTGTILNADLAGSISDDKISSAATWNAKQAALTLTTTGTSGAATLVGATLNIPQYTGGTFTGGTITSSLLANANNTLDLAASGTAFRTAYLGTSLFSPLISGGVNANDDITIQGTTNATRTTSYVNLQPSGGFVGIGTASPLGIFHINSSTANIDIYSRGGSSVGQGTLLRFIGDGNGDMARITALSTSTNGSANTGGSIAFGTNFANSGIITKMFIADNGNIAIGTQTPTALLHIKAPTATANTGQIKLAPGTAPTTPEDGLINYVTSTGLTFDVSSTRYILAKTLTNTATLDFGSTAAGTATDLTITVTGAVDGDPVSVGVPNGSTLANGSFTAWVSATNTVTVRFANSNLVTALDPASGTFRVSVLKY